MNLNLKTMILKKYGYQWQFAKEVKADESLISKIIREHRPPTAEQKREFAKALGCRIKDIFPNG